MAAKDAKDFRWENLFGHNETKKVFPDFLLSLLVIFWVFAVFRGYSIF
jgi:hypothetical protein